MNTEKKKTKVDLVTGFLGAGKTTFIKKYARYLLDKGCKIGVLENDFGAVNVDMLLLQELINDLCVVTMTDGCTWTEQHKTCSSIISFTLTPGTDEAALNAMLTALEGIQEQYSMTFQEKSTLVDELMQSSKEQLSEQGMIETFSKLEVLSKLLSSSRFADIEQKQESETVEASYIEEQTAALISEMETFLKSSSKPLARAVMAKLVTMVPLFIRDYNQLEEYIQNSLSSCSDVAEKLACIEIIRSL